MSSVDDIFARGWTPSRQHRAALFLLVGALLVAHPLVGGLPDAVGLTGTATYGAAEITPDGGEIELAWIGDRNASVRGELYRADGLTLVDCYPALFASERCSLESGLVNRGLTVRESPPTWSGYTYHGRFYERVESGSRPDVTLSLRPVDARAVLGEISVPAEQWTEPTRRAVNSGAVRVDPPLRDATTVLRRDGSYYVVVPLDGPARDEPPGPQYTAAFVAGGLLLARRGWQLAG